MFFSKFAKIESFLKAYCKKTLDSSGGGSILKKIHKKIILIRALIY